MLRAGPDRSARSRRFDRGTARTVRGAARWPGGGVSPGSWLRSAGRRAVAGRAPTLGLDRHPAGGARPPRGAGPGRSDRRGPVHRRLVPPGRRAGRDRLGSLLLGARRRETGIVGRRCAARPGRRDRRRSRCGVAERSGTSPMPSLCASRPRASSSLGSTLRSSRSRRCWLSGIRSSRRSGRVPSRRPSPCGSCAGCCSFSPCIGGTPGRGVAGQPRGARPPGGRARCRAGG